MKTDDLIEALAVGLEPVRPVRPPYAAAAGAGGLAVVGVWLILGFRPDLAGAAAGAAFWLKAAYTAALAGAALWLSVRLGRPGAAWRRPALALAAILAVAVAAAVAEQLALSPDQRLDAWLGQTWRQCAANVLMISALAAPLVFLAARRFAPTRPMVMGAALGVATGSIAATAYGLHCPEQTASFVAFWYSLAILAGGALGALIGRLALRW